MCDNTVDQGIKADPQEINNHNGCHDNVYDTYLSTSNLKAEDLYDVVCQTIKRDSETDHIVNVSNIHDMNTCGVIAEEIYYDTVNLMIQETVQETKQDLEQSILVYDTHNDSSPSQESEIVYYDIMLPQAK